MRPKRWSGRGSLLPASFSGSGRYLTFSAHAAGLATGGEIDRSGVFVLDLHSGILDQVIGVAAASGPVSDDGRFVPVVADETTFGFADGGFSTDVFLVDRLDDSIIRVTAGNASSFGARISGNGTAVSFTSEATDLAPGDVWGERHVYLWDRASETTKRVTTPGGNQIENAGISADGSKVLFWWYRLIVPGGPDEATDVMLWDGTTGLTRAVTRGQGNSFPEDMTPDTRHVLVFSDAENLVPGVHIPQAPIFVWDAGPS